MADAGAHVYDYFRQRYGPVVAAGIVGNTTQESSNNPNAPGGGLIQGQGGRTSSGTLEQQLHGIDAELRGPERHTLQALKGARTPQQAALIFSKMFERPGIPMNEKRQQYALEAFHRYGGRDAAHATAAGAIARELAPHLEPQGQNVAQSTDLAAALTAMLHSQPAQSAVSAPRRPQSAGGEATVPGAPKVPQAAQEAPQTSDSASLVSTLSKLATDASPESAAQPSGAQIQQRALAEGGGRAVQVAHSDIGKFAETEGANLGPELNKLEKAYGMTGAPWCAIFATTAATQGGAPAAARTASVAQINEWASQGSHGYQRGLKPSAQARPGDLLTFGTSHVALVKGIRNGRIITIEGNANGSGGVVELSHAIGEGRIARPKYR